MPLNGRQMTALITASGGSSPAPGGDFTGSKYSYQTISVSIAGGGGNTTLWRFDGGDNQDYMANGNLPYPFPDAVERVQRGVNGPRRAGRRTRGRHGQRRHPVRNESVPRQRLRVHPQQLHRRHQLLLCEQRYFAPEPVWWNLRRPHQAQQDVCLRGLPALEGRSIAVGHVRPPCPRQPT